MTSNKSADQGGLPPTPRPFPRKVENLIAAFRGFPENKSRSRVRDPRELAPIIDQLLAKYQIGRSTPESKLREKWKEIVGAANAAYSHPLEIGRGGRLRVLVSHPVVRSEIQLHHDEVMDRIRAVPGCESVKTLILQAS